MSVYVYCIVTVVVTRREERCHLKPSLMQESSECATSKMCRCFLDHFHDYNYKRIIGYKKTNMHQLIMLLYT